MKKHLMNQMNPMNLFRGLRYIKKYFLSVMGCTGSFLGSFRYISLFFGSFTLVSIKKLLKIDSLDVSNVHG